MATPVHPPMIESSSLDHAIPCQQNGRASFDQSAGRSTRDDGPAAESAPTTDTSTLRVLLIEDNPDDARLMSHLLQRTRARFHVCRVDCLAEARDKLRSESFDAILTDLKLPDSDGVESVLAIRQIAADTPLVVLTGLASDLVALAALDNGAQDYLTKNGATSDVLERSIRYAIQRQKNTEMRQLLMKVRANERLLARKNKHLARLNRTTHRFIDNVSHEFRTPLTVIMEYVSLLRDGLAGAVNEEQLGLLDIAMDRADDLNNMVNDMLDVSRLGAGILGFHRRSSRIEAIIDHIRPSLEKKAAIRGVCIKVEIDSGLPAVYCDPEKIGRVLINLAVNAIKFSGQPGHVRIHAALDPLISQAVISVVDNGPGIDPRRLGELFKRFKQLGAESRGSTKGFGLGLNIAKDLVNLNFGEVRVESQVGVGSTFAFTIPVDDPIEVTRRYLDQVKRGSSQLSLLQLCVDRSVEQTVADDLDDFLNHLLRRHDLIFRTALNCWVLLLAASTADVELFLVRARQVLAEANRNRPSAPLPEIISRLVATRGIQDQVGEILKLVRAALEPSEASAAS
jgi:signal transduction histidine kinase